MKHFDIYFYRFFVFIVIWFAAMYDSVGQGIGVKSFDLLPNDMDARLYYPKKDQNGDLCAIIKVVTSQKGFSWDNGSLGIVSADYKVGEYWLYVPYGTKKLTVSHDQLGILRDYLIPVPIEKGMVYEMVLVSGKVLTFVEGAVNNYLVIKTEPDNSMIYLDGNFVGTGVYQAPTRPGVYSYRIDAQMYHSEAGVIEMGVDKKVIDVVLKPAFGFLNLSTSPEDGAIIMIDSVMLNRKTPLTGRRIRSGLHTVSVIKPMFKEVTTKFEIKDNDTLNLVLDMPVNYGMITVNADKVDGEIFLNGNSVGKGIWTGKVNVGLNSIEVKRDGYVTFVNETELEAGDNRVINAEMIPITGSINIVSNPIDASISVDGFSYGTTPNIIPEVIIGNHTVILSKEGYENYRAEVTVEKGKTADLTVNLAVKKQQEVSVAPAKIVIDSEGGGVSINRTNSDGTGQSVTTYSNYNRYNYNRYTDGMYPDVLKIDWASVYYSPKFFNPGSTVWSFSALDVRWKIIYASLLGFDLNDIKLHKLGNTSVDIFSTWSYKCKIGLRFPISKNGKGDDSRLELIPFCGLDYTTLKGGYLFKKDSNSIDEDIVNNYPKGRSLFLGPGIHLGYNLWKFLEFNFRAQYKFQLNADDNYKYNSMVTGFKNEGFSLSIGVTFFANFKY